MWTAPLNVMRFGATTLWHFDAEERAPSTTSKAAALAWRSRVRCTPKSCRDNRPRRPLRANSRLEQLQQISAVIGHLINLAT
jgi:hypothetical protein